MGDHGTAAVVGGGIAGMTAAYRLRQAGLRTTVFEERDRVGGRIWSVRKGDFLMDLGTAVYLGTYRDAIALIGELGLRDELSERPAIGAMPRDGTLHHFDYGHPVRTGVRTRAISARSKLKAIKLAALVVKSRKSLGYDTYDGLATLDIETVREYCRRELNEELLQYAARPLVSGTWVADDGDSSVALLLWTIRNMLVPSVYNLSSGVAGLPDALAGHVDTRLAHPVSNVTDDGGAVDVTFTTPADGAERTERFDACVIATTAAPALALFPQMDENHRELYETTRYRRLGSICLGLSHRPSDPATYILPSPAEDPDLIAVIADHKKAPCRAPEGKGLLTVLLSHEYLERTDSLSNEQVLEYAIDRAERYHGPLGAIEEHMVVRWPESVPTIDRGRFKRIARFKRRLDRRARVQFASDLDRIPGLNGALVSGQEAAARVVAALGSVADRQHAVEHLAAAGVERHDAARE